MKTALIQMRVENDKAINLARAREKIGEAAKMGADLAVLPEMFCCPYSGKYFRDFAENENGPAQKMLSGAAREFGIIIVGGSVPENAGERLYNTSYVYGANGGLIAKHRKSHMFNINTKELYFRESDFFSAGDKITVFDTIFGKLGLCVCFDFRFPEPSLVMAREGAKAVIVPAAFNMTTGPAHWETMFRQRAVDNQIFTLGCAPARDEDAPYVSYGNSIAVNPWGEIISRCGGGEQTLIVDLDFSLIEKIRERLPLINARRTDIYETRGLKCDNI